MVSVGLVMVTRDRRESVLRSLARMPAGVPACVIDNDSRDGTAAAVRAAFPHVDVVALDHNAGAGGRTIGAERLGERYTAFVDDDSWWAPGALDRAVEVLESHPRLALLAGRVLVGPQQALDPVCAAMRDSPLTVPGLPGPPVLGFVACGAVVRTAAFLEVGGFDARYGVGGEERRLAVDLVAAGWELAYVDEVVTHHHPARSGRAGRPWRAVRNDLWTAWLRRPLPVAAARTVRLLRRPPAAVALRAAAEAARGLPWVLRERRPAPPHVEARLAVLDRAG